MPCRADGETPTPAGDVAHRRCQCKGRCIAPERAGTVNGMSEPAELGILLRRWRERVTPSEAGLTAGPGRRVPGLRRQEVARLSGVSADYIVQLEQGRATAPSTQVLAALARALRLSNFERDHLFRLAGYGPAVHQSPAPPADLRRLIDQLDATPAAVYDLCWNPVTWNPMWAAVNGDPLSRPVRERNMLWRLMTGLPTRVHRRLQDTQRVQQVLVGDLRARVGQHAHDGRLTGFVADLSAVSMRFRDMWNTEHIAAYGHEEKAIGHPQAGVLHLDCDVLTIGNDELRLIVSTAPRRSETADRIQQLHEGLDHDARFQVSA
jgi:transcriptional regulator with XRE-family HTH domain